MEKEKNLTGRVFRPLAAGALALCALLTVLAAAAAWPMAAGAGASAWLLTAALAVFALTGGGSVCLIRFVCRRYLTPVVQASRAVSLAAAGDHSASLTGIPRTSEETAALLDAARDLGVRSSDCLIEMEEVLNRIAEGDLTARLPCGRSAECGGACQALDGMSQKLRGAIGSARSAMEQLGSQLEELEREAQDLSQSGQDRRQDREALSTALERLTRCLQDRAGGAQCVSAGAEQLRDRLDNYDKKLETLTAAVERINDCALEAGKIVKTMESTAFQCSVLARTAYMEAAGAGVNGKGFAVVASELRVLASRSAQAAQDAAALMGEMDQSIREGSSLAAEASRELFALSGSSRELCLLSAGVAGEARDASDAEAAVRQAVRLSAAGAEDQLAASRAALSARMLRERAGRLREALRVFRLN
ncbi:MAG: methyl-accepting chemotaxis protein [Oscillospiraceae bacterium]|nr:methyl-accepting chemotaxis protein [Oscillospiraceae bacterium]